MQCSSSAISTQCCFGLGDADAPAEVADGGRRARRAGAARRGSACAGRPSPDVALLDQLDQLALAQHRVGEVQPRELVCCGWQGRAGSRSASHRAAGGPRTPACRSNG